MAVIDISTTPYLASVEHMKSREERKRTGRYVAAGTAIFLCSLGLYQVLIHGSPQYAALFVPALIMFSYILWILHTSKHQNAHLNLDERSRATELEGLSEECLKSNDEVEPHLNHLLPQTPTEVQLSMKIENKNSCNKSDQLNLFV